MASIRLGLEDVVAHFEQLEDPRSDVNLPHPLSSVIVIAIDTRQHITTEKGHGREETRVYVQMPAPKNLLGLSRWVGPMTIGAVFLT